jgi:hypothetical protein
MTVPSSLLPGSMCDQAAFQPLLPRAIRMRTIPVAAELVTWLHRGE